MTSPRNLGDRLAELEPVQPDRRARYEQAVKDMFEWRLSPVGKAFIGAVGVASMGIAVFLTSVAVQYPQLPALALVGLVGGVIYSLVWAGLCGWTLFRRTWYGRMQPTAIAVLAWTFAVLLVTVFLMLAPAAPDHYLWTVAILAGLGILIGAGGQLIATRVQQSELTTREGLLRLEYRLAELGEQMGRPQPQQ